MEKIKATTLIAAFFIANGLPALACAADSINIENCSNTAGTVFYYQDDKDTNGIDITKVGSSETKLPNNARIENFTCQKSHFGNISKKCKVAFFYDQTHTQSYLVKSGKTLKIYTDNSGHISLSTRHKFCKKASLKKCGTQINCPKVNPNSK